MAAMPAWCAAPRTCALLQAGNGLMVHWRARLPNS